jgi:hypothetical protein
MPPAKTFTVSTALKMLVTEFSQSNERLTVELRDMTTNHRKDTQALVETFSREMRSDREEMRRGFDTMQLEMGELRKHIPGKGLLALTSGMLLLCFVAVFGVLAYRGVDVGTVASAVRVVLPTDPEVTP